MLAATLPEENERRARPSAATDDVLHRLALARRVLRRRLVFPIDAVLHECLPSGVGGTPIPRTPHLTALSRRPTGYRRRPERLEAPFRLCNACLGGVQRVLRAARLSLRGGHPAPQLPRLVPGLGERASGCRRALPGRPSASTASPSRPSSAVDAASRRRARRSRSPPALPSAGPPPDPPASAAADARSVVATCCSTVSDGLRPAAVRISRAARTSVSTDSRNRSSASTSPFLIASAAFRSAWTSLRRSRASWLTSHAGSDGFWRAATSAASSRSPSLRSFFASSLRAFVNSSSGRP